ncbi:MAG TPA: hypothetical protein VF458_13795 [Ktedonobacteraceae bacterium]
MEEQQIQEFVHRAMMDQDFRRELALDSRGVIGRGGYSSQVTTILLRLAPSLAAGRPLGPADDWWRV